MPLSPVTSYYVRKILSQYRSRLRFIAAQNAALEAHALADLDAVLSSLYHDDGRVLDVANKLEDLVQSHQVLRDQGKIYAHYLITIEKEILELLGFEILVC